MATFVSDHRPVDLAPLRTFVTGFAALLDDGGSQRCVLEKGADLLGRLVANDGWLPDAYARPDPEHYRQYLLHCDSLERFSVVSFVWGPGQKTPIHDHRVWGMVGVLRGEERVQRYERDGHDQLHRVGGPVHLRPGDVDTFGPEIGDLHQVANGHDSRPSISIHVYGGNIGAVRRATYDDVGREKSFVSGYSNTILPNFWSQAQP